MNIILQILLMIMIIVMIVTQIGMFISNKKSVKLTDEVSRKMLEDLDLSIRQKLENNIKHKKTRKGE